MSELKTNRTFIVVILSVLLLFGGMLFIFTTTSATSKASSSFQCTNGQCNEEINTNNEAENGQTQDIYIKALSNGTYDKSEVTVKKGIPVNLHFSADQEVGCGKYLSIYGMNVSAISKKGEEVIVKFTPQKEGVFEYNCGMRMFRGGKMVVVP